MSKLEPELESEYNAWRKDPSPATTGALLGKLRPTITYGVSRNVGPDASPNIYGHAKRIAIQALKTYDPNQAKLSTHVVNNLQGLRRVSRKQTTAFHVPERVSLEAATLSRAHVELSDLLGRDPSTSELADHTGIPTKRIAYVRRFSQPLSEGALISKNTDDEGEDYAMPGVVSDPHKIYMEAVHSDLAPRDQLIMEHALGLHGRPQLAGKEIAARLNVTPGAVSQRLSIIRQKIAELEQTGLFH